jgi:hypothetical protein
MVLTCEHTSPNTTTMAQISAVSGNWRPILTPQHTESSTNTFADTAMAQIVASGLPWMAPHDTQHHTPRRITMMVTVVMLDLLTASGYDSRAATARFLSVLARHCWWGVLLLVQYSRYSVGSLSMDDMLHSTFLINSTCCCACKIINSDVII